MADATFAQSSFLGGQFSAVYQGRFDDKRYPEGMNVCLNAFPMEEGAWTRRSGTLFGGITRNGKPAWLREFDVSDALPYVLEFSPYHLRFWSLAGEIPQLVMTPETQTVASISSADPAIVTLAGSIPGDWLFGDNFIFGQSAQNNSNSNTPLYNTQWQYAANPSGDEMVLADPVTGTALDGTSFTPTGTILLNKVLDIATPYTNTDYKNVRIVQTGASDQLQTEPEAVVLCKGFPPQTLEFTSPQNSAVFATFTMAPSIFQDGPYLDPPGNGAQLIASAKTGVVTLTVSYQTWLIGSTYANGDYVTAGGLDYQSLIDNNIGNTPSSSPADWQLLVAGAAIGGVGFQSTDIGRSIRLYSEPQPWVSTQTYTAGQAVKYNGLYYVMQGTNTGSEPDIAPVIWAVTPTAANMVWARITAVTSSVEVSAQILAIPNLNDDVNTAALLYSGSDFPISQFQMGLYSGTTGYPSCGVYYQGRLWLGGLVPNRFDATVTNSPSGSFIFSPSAADNTVADNCGIAEVLNSDEVENILWFQPSTQGLILGTEGGEWLVQASQLNDPITPTSIEAHRVSKNKCANVDPIHAPMAMIFVQKSGRKLIEYFPDVFSGKYSSRNLSLRAKDLSKNGFIQIAYQQELSPAVWAIDVDGFLYGCSYKRESPFATEEATIVGWHRHTLGSGRNVLSITSGPGSQVDNGEALDALTLCTQDPTTNVCFIETMAKMFEQDDTLLDAWFLDAGVVPSFASISSTNVTFYGLGYLNGKSVDVWGAGLDLGTYIVSNGEIVVPFSTSNPAFNQALLGTLNGETNSQGASTWINYSSPYVVPDGLTSWVPSSSVLSGISSGVVLPQWDFDVVTLAHAGSGSGDGLRQMKIREGNTLVHEATTPEIFANVTIWNLGYGGDQPSIITPSIPNGPVAIDSRGYIFFACDDANQSPIAVVRAHDFVLVGLLGVDFSHMTTSGYLPAGSPLIYGPGFLLGVSYGIASPADIATCVIGELTYVCTIANKTASAAEITLVSFDPEQFDPQGYSGGAFLSTGNFSSSSTTAGFCVGGAPVEDRFGHYQFAPFVCMGYNAAGDTTTLEFTITDAITNDYTHLTGVACASIDSTCTKLTNVNGLIYDSTDGCVIFMCSTNGSGAHQNFVCKYSPTTESIVWASGLPNTGFLAAGSMKATRTLYGQLCWISDDSGTEVMNFLNTANGDYTTANVIGATGTTGAYDDVTGMMAYYGSFTATGSAWPQLNAGSSNFSNDWGAISSPSTLAGPATTGGSYQVPFEVGFTFTSQGQLLRQVAPQSSGARNGPALGKTRRTQQIGLLLQNCPTNGAVTMGTDFAHLTGLFPTDATKETPLPAGQLFSGSLWDILEDTYSLDGMIAWQITRPYPLAICAVQGFLHTQDR